jgi:hypothetical protein
MTLARFKPVFFVPRENTWAVLGHIFGKFLNNLGKIGNYEQCAFIQSLYHVLILVDVFRRIRMKRSYQERYRTRRISDCWWCKLVMINQSLTNHGTIAFIWLRPIFIPCFPASITHKSATATQRCPGPPTMPVGAHPSSTLLVSKSLKYIHFRPRGVQKVDQA